MLAAGVTVATSIALHCRGIFAPRAIVTNTVLGTVLVVTFVRALVRVLCPRRGMRLVRGNSVALWAHHPDRARNLKPAGTIERIFVERCWVGVPRLNLLSAEPSEKTRWRYRMVVADGNDRLESVWTKSQPEARGWALRAATLLDLPMEREVALFVERPERVDVDA